jgi:TolB protein
VVAGLGFFFVAASSPVLAEQRAAVVVRGSDVSVLKVALQSFAVHGASLDETTAASFRAQVESALEFSSLFKSIDPKGFLGPVTTKSLTGRRGLRCADWRAVGADLFIEGVLSEEPQRLIVEVQVWDVAQCKKLEEGGKRYKAGRMEADLIARHFVDELIEEMTGRRGVSNTDIAFVSDRNGNREIFVMNSDGSGLRQGTRNGSVNSLPAWSPDGRTIYYASYRTQRRPALFMLKQGQNGKQIVFVSDRTGSPQLYIMDADGRNTRRLTFTGGYNSAPDWSPDGRWIVYELRVEGQFDIWLTDPEGKVNVPLITHRRSDESPSWSPDSRKIAFSSNRRGNMDVYVVDLNGENLRRVTQSDGNSISPTWGPYKSR